MKIIHRSTGKWNSANFALTEFSEVRPLTVRGELRGLPETHAEIFYPLLGSLPRHAYLRLFDALFAVGAVPEFPELRACLGVQNGLHRFFDGLTTPVRPDLRFSANFACTEFLDPLCART